ncbi:phospholipase D-like domain-containing protein [Baekduia sp. Peel2402]|uniref:phospholipase D-like domain-containing protein n=1 Tax=Baekduia sp. Peel2402 TaxID=3458296 RepID=UPI00403E3D2C
MRAKPRAKSGITINAVAGTRVVFLGLDLAKSKHAGCLGFAISRHDAVNGETRWLRGMKTFAETDPGVGPAANVSTFDHPIQGFWWADYEVAPGREYTYEVVPRYGTPAALTSRGSASVTVTTEPEAATAESPHAIFFNRGAVASQEYARDFQDVLPKNLAGDLQKAAYRYLSHGLEEALLAFVARAANSRWSLHGAVYEFNWPSVLEALGAARDRKAKVSVVYDAISSKSGPRAKSATAIKQAGIGDICTPRTQGKIMHNKFFVLMKDKQPVAVWTGSTNISENGIFGHLNVGHVVEDPVIAQAYLDYWTELAKDSPTATIKDWVNKHNPEPPAPPAKAWKDPVSAVFSPHTGDDVLQRYAELAGQAKQGLCMTFAFGMNKAFQGVYGTNDNILRLALMEDYGVGRTKAEQTKKIKALQTRSNVVVALGGSIPLNGFDGWLAEANGLTNNVQWVHTKFMLVDPLSASPTVVTGSANFSDASTDTNDENMLVIRGDRRVADIYFTEYIRLFAHYGFREAVAIAIDQHETFRPKHLKAKTAEWLPPYFTAGDDRDTRRRYFATGKTH